MADIRAGMVTDARHDIAANASRFTYGEVRPIPLAAYVSGKKVTTDCSGWYDCLAFANKAPNPFGGPYNGAGSTVSLLSFLTTIKLADALPGDCVVYAGPVEKQHVAMFLQPGTHGQATQMGSFGSQGGPRAIALGDETAAHPGQPVVYKRLPAMRTVWVVKNGAGDVLVDATAHPVAWAIAHPKAFRKYGRVTFIREERES